MIEIADTNGHFDYKKFDTRFETFSEYEVCTNIFFVIVFISKFNINCINKYIRKL